MQQKNQAENATHSEYDNTLQRLQERKKMV